MYFKNFEERANVKTKNHNSRNSRLLREIDFAARYS